MNFARSSEIGKTVIHRLTSYPWKMKKNWTLNSLQVNFPKN